ncbi:hypothetical protein DSLASN_18200 [Desulfoluna limicola]|uniref:Uncharacterized protein n=1 Tax=Desulfoluna limicola TaxID=2810562 RepID=A0ABM7PEZ6_9BACT|nr:hypothetical protein DSLASN_18200 [Desulfoluna limicola]
MCKVQNIAACATVEDDITKAEIRQVKGAVPTLCRKGELLDPLKKFRLVTHDQDGVIKRVRIPMVGEGHIDIACFNQGVGAAAAVKGIDTGTAGEGVIPFATNQDVVTSGPDQDICASRTIQGHGSRMKGFCAQRVVAGTSG